MTTIIELYTQALQTKDVLIHLGGFQQLADCVIERLVKAFFVNGFLDCQASGPAEEVVDGKAHLVVAEGCQIGRALRPFVNLPKELYVYLCGLIRKVSQYNLLAVKHHMLAGESAVNV